MAGKGKQRSTHKAGKTSDPDRPPKAQHMDCMHRLNFLYQAAHLYTVKQHGPNTAPQTRSVAGLSRLLGQQMKLVAKKLVIRLDPHIKRTICKKCHGALVPGISSTVRTGAEPSKKLEITCLYCNTIRTLGINPRHVLFNDKNEWVDPSETVSVPISKDIPSSTAISDLKMDG
ncbi:hypothetical protein BASA50_009749 [Batrachochytrium salamandrivorans]|uniref:Rpr2-domain-containing protein n=1 Tax=Batrachochytrium salamandrivorans TaxID=1357716 RepID=A0ABQ8F3W8_9FUNG|nr:hypothetical protein BASA62_004676 [Batrachochytrium salamandrivorans]KAH6570968.1 hypothetical protein BASA60_007397 [Batrachochytrium salamandrivorans]KAH6590047.1 hypothetical protein BASA50_009749 [Batrachochytrium salamandrivorans]KAH6592327.1 hypothetical protein BASA61_004650 [Batrachochytrium salamandrivorans]KAH9252644.1 hypothetical protein BASA81_009424 [Batrachochytrium salamandrivorans]